MNQVGSFYYHILHMIMNEKYLLFSGNNLQNQIKFPFSITNIDETSFEHVCQKPRKS